jgi:flagellin-like protein
MRKRVLGRVDSKAISPVIATVILVAITIVVALAFAFWASGLLAAFQQTERLEVKILMVGATQATVHIRNMGSNDVTVTDIFIMQQGTTKGTVAAPGTLSPGSSMRLFFTHGVSKGASFELVVITASGNIYTATGTVPA